MMIRIILAVGLLATVDGALAADWTQWRGPGRNGHSPDRSTAKSWPNGGPKRVWLFENAGLGYSGYSIVGTRVFTMGARDDVEHVICLDRNTGKELWASPLGAVYTNRWGDGPRSTPTVDGDRVFGLSGRGILACLSVKDGKSLWKVDLVKDLGGELQGWGYTESVLVNGPHVVCTPGGKNGTVAALDKASGKTAWQTSDLKESAQYSSPILATHKGKPQYIQRTMRKLFGIEPASGDVLWETGFPGSVAVIPTPIYADGIAYVTAGYESGCKAVRPDSAEPEIVYENKTMVNHHGGVVLVDGKVYGHSNSGGWTCQDFKTGEKVWQDEGIGKGSCTYVAGMLVCLAEKDGTVALVDASPSGWKVRSKFKLDPQTTKRKPDGRIWTHPVVVDGRLYLRDQDLISCYDVKG